MWWLRIVLLFTVVAALLATMVGETIETKMLASAIFCPVLGLIWALLLHLAPRSESSDWNKVKNNVAEAQRLINQSSYSTYRRKMFGLQPQQSIENLDILETIKSPVSIGLFIMLSTMVGLNPDLISYVFNFENPIPPVPKTLLLYLGFLFCLSTVFLGIFLWVIKWFQKLTL